MKRVNNASGYSYMQQKVRKCSEEMALIMEENERLKKNLKESKNWQKDLESNILKVAIRMLLGRNLHRLNSANNQ